MSDSLISGQPLYLLYSKSYLIASAGAALFVAALARHATGRVRLQVTGSPPTTSEFGLASAQPWSASGSVDAARPWMSCRRVRNGRFTGNASCRRKEYGCRYAAL